MSNIPGMLSALGVTVIIFAKVSGNLQVSALNQRENGIINCQEFLKKIKLIYKLFYLYLSASRFCIKLCCQNNSFFPPQKILSILLYNLIK